METTAEKRERLRRCIDTEFKALTIDEVAAISTISSATLYAMKTEGTGPRFTKIGHRTVVLLGDYENWMKECRSA